MSQATATPAPAVESPSIFRRAGNWFTSPWRKPRFLLVFTLLYMVWSIVPILIAVRFSFNEGRSRSTAQGWSFNWYWGDPDLSVWHNDALRSALYQSLKLAGLAILIAVPIGVALAIGLTRWRGRASGGARFVSLLPLVTPELVMGVALFLVIVNLFTFIPLGTTAQVIGHVTFSISFVLIIVRGRLLSIGRDYEEAAMDLGASPVNSIRMILLPMLSPAIVASAIIVFAISMDDFVISAYLASGSTTETVPVKIYSNARGSPTPALNALASLTLFLTIALALIMLVVWAFVRRRQGARGSTVGELTRLDS